MAMRQAINGFPEQFAFQPEVMNASDLPRSKRLIVCGMGGSHLAADLLNERLPNLDIWVWKDYGLPPLANEVLQGSLVIASSYSGNTEETIDAYLAAREIGASVAVIATGGKLLELAKTDGVPWVKLPETGIQPRSALGFSLRAMLALLGLEGELAETSHLASRLKPEDLESVGRDIAKKINGYVPVIYASRRNWPLAYNWKIKFNETGKIPAFANFLPELNHNEMTGFDQMGGNEQLRQKFTFIFLADPEDDPRITKRMEILGNMYMARNLPVQTLELVGKDAWEKIFSNLLIADWAAFYTAEQYGLEAEQVPMVEEFKKMVSGI